MNNMRPYCIRKNELLFFIPYTIFLVYSILSVTFYLIDIQFLEKTILILSCVLLLMKEVSTYVIRKSDFRGLLIALLLFLLTLMNSQGGQNNVPATILFVYAARNIKFDRIARWTVIISTFTLAFVILSAKLGVIQEYHTIQIQNERERLRNYLGFLYALYPATIIFNITCLIIALRKNKIKIWQAALLCIVNYWFYYQTNSRMVFALAIVLIVMAMVFKHTEQFFKRRKVLQILECFSYIVCFAISFFLTVIYNPSKTWMYKINIALGQRLELGYKSIIKNGIPLMGQKINWVGNGLNALGEKSTEEYTYVDSLYIQILQRYGVVFCVVFLIIITLVMIRIKKSQDIYLLSVLMLIAVHCMIDNLQLYLHFNTFWLLTGRLLMTKAADKEFVEDGLNVFYNQKKIGFIKIEYSTKYQ